MVPELHQGVCWGQSFKWLIFPCLTIFSMKYNLKSIPGLAEVGVPHGNGHGARTQGRCLGGHEKILAS